MRRADKAYHLLVSTVVKSGIRRLFDISGLSRPVQELPYLLLCTRESPIGQVLIRTSLGPAGCLSRHVQIYQILRLIYALLTFLGSFIDTNWRFRKSTRGTDITCSRCSSSPCNQLHKMLILLECFTNASFTIITYEYVINGDFPSHSMPWNRSS